MNHPRSHPGCRRHIQIFENGWLDVRKRGRHSAPCDIVTNYKMECGRPLTLKWWRQFFSIRKELWMVNTDYICLSSFTWPLLACKDYSCFHGYQWIKTVTMVSLHGKRTLCSDDLLRHWGKKEGQKSWMRIKNRMYRGNRSYYISADAFEREMLLNEKSEVGQHAQDMIPETSRARQYIGSGTYFCGKAQARQ